MDKREIEIFLKNLINDLDSGEVFITDFNKRDIKKLKKLLEKKVRA